MSRKVYIFCDITILIMLCFDDKELQNHTLDLYKKYFYDLPFNLKNIKFAHMKENSVLGYTHAELKKGKQLIDDVNNEITNNIFISKGYIGINCTSTVLHEMCHAYVETNFHDTEWENNANHKGLWVEITELISKRSGLNCFWSTDKDTLKVTAKDVVEKIMEKSNRLYDFFNKIDDKHVMHDIKNMMKYKDTREFLQLLMEDKQSDWKEYWNRLLEWENVNFEYWKNSKECESWLFYIAFGE